MKTCIALRHVPFESLGLLEPVLRERGFNIQYVDVPSASLADVDVDRATLVVVLGGPISVYEELLYPFLTHELHLLERRLANGMPTLGICLGAQLIARALGAEVHKGRGKELGWSRLQLTRPGRIQALEPLDEQPVLHWHGDTFELPQGATLWASSALTPNQAFCWQNTAIALQFHLEVTAYDLEAWYVGNAFELSTWTKSTIPELRAEGRVMAPRLAPHAKRVFAKLFDEFLDTSR
jgi:GMP synthase (glutamine-hydrolysing)